MCLNAMPGAAGAAPPGATPPSPPSGVPGPTIDPTAGLGGPAAPKPGIGSTLMKTILGGGLLGQIPGMPGGMAGGVMPMLSPILRMFK